MGEERPAKAGPAPLRDVAAPPPLPTVSGGFATILADPPWRFANRTGKVAPEHRRLDRYSTLSLDEICALDVANVASTNAHLYLWVPNALLPEGIRVMQVWGFRYVSNIVWSKVRKDGLPDGRGVGFYFRNTTELLLFGVRGSMRTLAPARSQVNQIVTRKREHSRKPDEQYDLIEACSPGPFLEMFGRYRRENWVVWGDEAAEDVEPRGQPQKGYAGGEIERLPSLEPHTRLPEWLATPIAAAVRSAYDDGMSINDIAKTSGYSISRVRHLLDQSGAQKRGRGRPG